MSRRGDEWPRTFESPDPRANAARRTHRMYRGRNSFESSAREAKPSIRRSWRRRTDYSLSQNDLYRERGQPDGT